MSAELLSSVAGIVLSLMFSYIPGIKSWFENLENMYKQSIMGILLFLVAVAVYGLSCLGVGSWVACTKEGGLGLLNIFIYALIANQSAYLITKK